MPSKVVDLPADIFATLTGFSTTHELLQIRSTCRGFQRKVDSDNLWHARAVDVLRVHRAKPQGSSWRDFVLRHGLLRMLPSMGPLFGTWQPISNFTENRIRVPDDLNLVETLRPPQPLHLATPTVSVGLLCVSRNVFDKSWASLEKQAFQFLGFSPMQPKEHVEQKPVTTFVASNASLQVLNAFPSFPQNGSYRTRAFRMVMCAVDSGVAQETVAMAEYFAALMHTCAIVHIVGDNEAELVSFAQRIAPFLPTVQATAFSTNANTPTIVFVSNESKEINVARVLQQCPDSFQTWILNRSSSVGTSKVSHENVFSILRTPFAVPSYAAAGVTAPVGPATIVRMAQGYLNAGLSRDMVINRQVWSDSVVRHSVKGHVAYHAAFYMRAMTTDFEEHTRAGNGARVGTGGALQDQCRALVTYDRYRLLSAHTLPSAIVVPPEEHTDPQNDVHPLRAAFRALGPASEVEQQFQNMLAAFPQQRAPMDPHEMVEIHNGHFYAALRRFAFALPSSVGSDTEKGLRQLESLKREIADAFRVLWRQNNEYSRVYCNTLFVFVIAAPLFSKFFTDRYASESPTAVDRTMADGNEARYGIHEKRGLKNFFRAAKDMMEEYQLKGRGLRQFDILSERLADSLIPAVMTFCTLHPHVNTPLSVVREACEELQKEVVKANATYSQNTDGRLNVAQSESALYTASLSSEWAAEAERAAIQHMTQIEDDVEAWESACLARIRILLSPPTADRNSRASSSQRDDLSSSQQPTTTEGGYGGSLGWSEGLARLDSRDNVDMEEDDDEKRVQLTTEELEEAEDSRRRHEYEEARRQLLQQAMVSEANFRSQSARLSSRIAQSSQHTQNFAVVRSTGSESGTGSLAGRLRTSLRNLLS